jgi:hypothetical protein
MPLKSLKPIYPPKKPENKKLKTVGSGCPLLPALGL